MPYRTSRLRRGLCALLCAATAIMNLPSVARAETSPPGVVIGEIAWAGSSVSLADEWIELWNLGEADVPLGGWSLSGAGDNGRVIVFPPDAVLSARSVFLITNYAAGDPKTALAATPNMTTTTLALSNSAILIELRDANGTFVDRAGDGGTPAVGTTSPVKSSMIRTDPAMDGGDENAWMTATASARFLDNVRDLGTPGLCDGCTGPLPPSDPPVEEAPATEESATSTTDIPELSVFGTSSSTDNGETTGVAPTSTEETVFMTTTTEETMEPAPEHETATTTAETPDESAEPDEAETASAASEPETADPPKPAYAMLRLNEIAPNPETGKEWVEILSLDRTNPIPLEGCELHDATGRILTLGKITIDPATSSYVVIEITSSKLNNGGDAVALYDPAGELLDAMTYGETSKGKTWVRYPEPDGIWQETLQPTSGAANALATPPAEAPAPIPTAEPMPAAPTAAPTPAAKSPAAPRVIDPKSKSPQPQPAKPTTAVSEAKKTTAPSASKTRPIPTAKPKTQTKTATKKPTTKTAPVPPLPISIDMATSDELAGVRVLLRGTVGSPPALLTNHTFVLHAPDGRGLRVSVPTNRKLPALGGEIEVAGMLRFDDRGVPTLKLGSKDGWKTHGTSTQNVLPRPVDLTLPSTEDAWSLVRVTGTVKSAKNQTILLDLEDAEIAVIIRNVVKYRTKRLATGDVVDVTGVLDTAGVEPKLLPRTADDILLLRHAEPKITLNAKNDGTELPGWTPFGAAAGAVAVTEGVKHAQRRMRRKALEHKLAQLTNESSSS